MRLIPKDIGQNDVSDLGAIQDWDSGCVHRSIMSRVGENWGMDPTLIDL